MTEKERKKLAEFIRMARTAEHNCDNIDLHIANFLIDMGVIFDNSNNKYFSNPKLELCILRAICDIKNEEYESAEKQLIDARKILENKEN